MIANDELKGIDRGLPKDPPSFTWRDWEGPRKSQSD